MDPNVFTFLILLFCCPFSCSNTKQDFCNPTKPDHLNVHMISHTHLDTGWLETYDGYYEKDVMKIMKSVIESLTKKDSDGIRKFTFAEMSYFSRYWNSVNNVEKQVIRKLISSGKLQFTSGGWVMNDEATPHYLMIIDQMSYGHRWINRTFGKKFVPTTGWQIDPFGHSREFASILSQMGFNALLLGRIDYQDKQQRLSDKRMEFIWKTDENLKQNNYMFTGITPTGYNPPEEISIHLELDVNGNRLIEHVIKHNSSYRTNHIMATMGGDFLYYDSDSEFINVEKIIENVNSKQNHIYLHYSTPDCYVKAVYESGLNWTDIETGDFMPYADLYDDYWTGYFTSRPAFKYLLNYMFSILQITKQLVVMADIYSVAHHLVQPLEEAVAICMHHDAITGTSRQVVNNDYIVMLSKALVTSEQLIRIAYQKILYSKQSPQFCHKLNVSECQFTENLNGRSAQIILYNSLAHPVSHYLRIPLNDTNYIIIKPEEGLLQTVPAQIVAIPKFIELLAERHSKAKYELIFEANLDPMSFTKYILKNCDDQHCYSVKHPDCPTNPKVFIISNKKIQVFIDKNTGLLKGIRKNGLYFGVNQYFGYYTRGTGKVSGAYSLHTDGPHLKPISSKPTVCFIKDNLFEEVVQEFTPYLKQIIRVYENTDHIEFDWTVGPLPSNMDFELVSRFDTGFRTNKKFYTDSNGRQTMERIRDTRPNWSLDASEKVSSNYYPISGWIFIRDEKTGQQMTLIPDRTQGGSSLVDGSIELMIHRRLQSDDGYGISEELNEPGVDGKGLVIRGKHYLLIDTIENSMKKVKTFSKLLFWKPLTLFLDITSDMYQLSDNYLSFVDNNSTNNILDRMQYSRPNWQLWPKDKVKHTDQNRLLIRTKLAHLKNIALISNRTQSRLIQENRPFELIVNKDNGFGNKRPEIEDKKHRNEIQKQLNIFNKQFNWRSLPLFGISLTDKLDPAIHLLTLEELEPNLLFIRFEYIFETSESKSESISFLLNGVFIGFEILSITETSLTGTESLSDIFKRKYKWICNECDKQIDLSNDLSKLKITLTNNQIRSLLLKIRRYI